MTCVSLVVPVKDEAASVEALIGSIQAQVRQPDEVILVDGGSSDGTVSILLRLIDGDGRYCVLEAGLASPGRGRNVGIEAATHEWLALTDAGIQLDPHWLDRLCRLVEHDPTLDVVYGSYAPAQETFFERCADLAYVSPPTPSPVGPVRSFSVASCLVRKEAWRRAGGFPDLRAAEDRIFMRELDALGCRVATAPEAHITWQLQPTVRRMFQRFRSHSMHGALADEEGDWHHGVARLYLAVLAGVTLAKTAGRSPLPIVVVAAGLRVVRTVWRRREGRGILWALRPDRLAAVAAILAVVDAGLFVGWLDAFLLRRRPDRAS